MAAARETRFRQAVRLVLSPAALLLVSLAGIGFLYNADNDAASLPFAFLTTAALAAILFLLSRRLAFSVYGAWALVGIVTVISFIKFEMKGFDLHAFDIAFVSGDSSLVAFLWRHYPQFAVPVVAAAVLGIAALAMLCRLEPPRPVTLPRRLLAVLLAFVLVPLAMPQEAKSHFFFMRGRHASSFFVSIRDLGELFGRSALAARLARRPAEPAYAAPAVCGTGPQPDLVMLLGESHLPPSLFPAWKLPDSAVGSFASDDGTLRRLGVETFGGGTWITGLSIMSGLSAADFGWMRPYLTTFLEGRVRQSVPEILAGCGYDTAAILVEPYSFVNEGPFLSSIGFRQVLDSRALRVPSSPVRDSFYLDAAKRLIAGHRARDGRPLFLFVQTMFPHSPYGERLDPATRVAGEPLARDPEAAEYLRRLALSRRDIAAFTAAIAADPGPRGTLLVDFGDHQPFVTEGGTRELGREDALTDWRAPQFQTYYALHAYGAAWERPIPAFPRLDAAYLGFSVIEAAGLAGGGVVSDLIALRDHCEGLFHDCADRAAVDAHLGRRAASRLLDLGGGQPGLARLRNAGQALLAWIRPAEASPRER